MMTAACIGVHIHSHQCGACIQRLNVTATSVSDNKYAVTRIGTATGSCEIEYHLASIDIVYPLDPPKFNVEVGSAACATGAAK